MVEVEKALIGAILLCPDILSEIVSIVKTSDFLDNDAALAYSEMLNLYKTESPIDMVTVSASGRVSLIYLSGSTDVGFVANSTEYAKTIAEKSKVIRLKKALETLGTENNSSDILTGITSVYEKEASVVSKDPNISKVIERFESHVNENKLRGSLGLETGIKALTEKMIFYVKGQIWLMGGYTSTGKTAVMVQKIINIFENNESPSVTVISTEMTEEQMVGRLLGNMCGIYSQKILAGTLNPFEQEKYSNNYKKLKSWDLRIHDDISELSDIEAISMKNKMQGGVDVTFIDYVQNCKVGGVNEAYNEQRILAKSFQQLAKKVDTTIVALSQVSNDVGRGNVDTFEMKGAGEWAAVTDVGVMLTRGKNDDEELLYSIPKNRHGPKTNVVFRYENNFSRLRETPEKDV